MHISLVSSKSAAFLSYFFFIHFVSNFVICFIQIYWSVLLTSYTGYINQMYFLFYFIIVSWMRLGPLGTAATTGILYQSQMIDDGDCGEIGRIKIGKGHRSTRRKSAPAPLCPPQIPHDQTRARTRAAVVGSQRLTAWAMARPNGMYSFRRV
jgi:hypothetical protein